MTRDPALLIWLAALACAAPPVTDAPDLSREPPAVGVGLGTPFSLRMGETADVDGRLRVTALAVTGDSRCPANAVCVWAGEAAVAIRLNGQGLRTRTDTLHTTPDRRARTTYGSLSLILVALDPPAMAGETLSGYKATFRADSTDAKND